MSAAIEVSTDKVDTEIESPSGVVAAEIVADTGSPVAIGGGARADHARGWRGVRTGAGASWPSRRPGRAPPRPMTAPPVRNGA
jgi:pyruvate/2-oxoglutarate dehydrogenase complex dihydrolipoamide acyltransferase (E2) component